MNTATDTPQRTLVDAEPRPAALPAVQRQAQPAAVANNQESASFIQIIAAAARDPSVDIEKMERLWVMHEKLRNHAAEHAFNEAMSKAQAEMRPIATDADNPQTRSRYATYARMDGALRPIYTKHGFSISYDTGDGAPDGCIRVLAYVSCGGYTRTYRVDMPADGKGAKGGDVMTKTHASGAAMSYGMRYLLKMIFNVAIGEDDNDGNGPGDDGDEGGQQQRNQTPEQKHTQALLDSGQAAAMEGMAALTKWWGKLSTREQKLMNPHFGAMRKAARAADQGGGRGNS